MLQPVYC